MFMSKFSIEIEYILMPFILLLSHKNAVETLKQTVEMQQIRINQLSSVANLTFHIISDIYKSHLIKGTSCLIF